eukprot:TRINITY_DN49054_c0_g1_i1.p2 TRINITY_DN49054_c0_g1~~TRINITY_DN49054_c0_g1_i1.p2  ORF type:complete len:337 (-),score=67.93 TRINITY_DN49054_c0_g1_i1:38-1012(-)
MALVAAQDPNMRVFWGDRTQDKISRADLNGNGISVAVKEGVGAIHNLVAVPGRTVSTAPQLYWTDTEAGSIKTARGDNRGRVSTVIENLLSPKSLVLFIDAQGEEWLYYCEAANNGVIGRVKTDGSGQETMVTVRSGYFPQSFDIDIVDERLIYNYMKTPQDGGIAHVTFDTSTGTVGSTETVVFEEIGIPNDMSASAVYNPREIIASSEPNVFFYQDLFTVFKVTGTTPSTWLSDRSVAWFDAEELEGTLYWTEGLNDKTMYSSPDFAQSSVSTLQEVLPTGLGSTPAGLTFAPYNSAGLLSASVSLMMMAIFAAVAGMADVW